MQRNLVSLAVLATVMGGAAIFSSAAEAGKPGSGGIASPFLVYINRSGSIEVSNEDGGSPTVLLAGSAITQPNWSPLGTGTSANPYHIYYSQPLCHLHRFDVAIVAGIPKATNFFDLPMAIDCPFAPDLSGDKLVFGESYVEQGLSHLWIRDTITGTQEAIYTAADAGWGVTFASFNQDGTRIAFEESDGNAPYGSRLKIISQTEPGNWATASVAMVLNESQGFDPRFIEWSPTADTLTFTSGPSIYTMNVGPTPALSNPAVVTGGAISSWSPGGTELAYGGTSGTFKINLATGAVKALTKGAARPKFRN